MKMDLTNLKKVGAPAEALNPASSVVGPFVGTLTIDVGTAAANPLQIDGAHVQSISFTGSTAKFGRHPGSVAECAISCRWLLGWKDDT